MKTKYPKIKDASKLYHYRALVTKVTDGDTIHVEIDLGFRIKSNQVLRFYGIDAPEIYHPRNHAELFHGEQATRFVKDRIGDKEIMISTVKNTISIYGRWDALIFYKNEMGEYIDLIQELKDNGFEKKAVY